jgi:hypothetical protein
MPILTASALRLFQTGLQTSAERLSFSVMTHPTEALGIIAGNRSLPLAFAREAGKSGVLRLVAVAFEVKRSRNWLLWSMRSSG